MAHHSLYPRDLYGKGTQASECQVANYHDVKPREIVDRDASLKLNTFKNIRACRETSSKESRAKPRYGHSVERGDMSSYTRQSIHLHSLSSRTVGLCGNRRYVYDNWCAYLDSRTGSIQRFRPTASSDSVIPRPNRKLLLPFLPGVLHRQFLRDRGPFPKIGSPRLCSSARAR